MAHNQPRSYDVVLGGQTPTPVNAAVLGGVAGVKRRLTSQNVAQRVTALSEALKYGEAGLDLIFQSLKDESWQVSKTAYLLIQNCEELTLKRALQEYNPYQLFECLHKHPTAQSTTYSVAISADGQYLVSGGSDKKIVVRSLHTGRIIRALSGHTDGVKSVAISESGQTIFSCSWDNTIKVWNLLSSKALGDGLLYTFAESEAGVNCICIAPDGKTLATGNEDGNIGLWNLEKQANFRTLTAHKNGIKSIAITPDGKMLATGSADETIKIWHLPTGELLHTLEGHSEWVKSLAISPDGKTLISGAQDKTIKLWNLQTGELLNTLEGHWDEVTSIAINRDGNTLASGGGNLDQTIRIWHLKTGTLLQVLEGHFNGISSIAMTPDGEKIVSSSWDKTIRVWGAR
ncbi:MAG TPA: WD40 repeat domain-containing protein [Cyanobacteria bacterium UBA11369]|nr:WD40 repeat domain-containing protein [Cyanobacteria bacterium UBA11371]HBE30234.1 WD40 repeat domain-containing protein [Cyanobacteria bacterium UBA11368]HBE51634.1 WD40 repeat domain-containing protein [Cyanobacteria bacterium UBA11369]